jgi:hypothetical protein
MARTYLVFGDIEGKLDVLLSVRSLPAPHQVLISTAIQPLQKIEGGEMNRPWCW